MVAAAVENKKRKRSHADKRANKKKQEIEKGEAKPVEENTQDEKPAEGEYTNLARSFFSVWFNLTNCSCWGSHQFRFREPWLQREHQKGYQRYGVHSYDRSAS